MFLHIATSSLSKISQWQVLVKELSRRLAFPQAADVRLHTNHLKSQPGTSETKPEIESRLLLGLFQATLLLTLDV